MRRFFCVLIFFAFMPVTEAGQKDVNRRWNAGVAHCEDMTRKINLLVPYTTTSCLPITGAPKISFIIISSEPIMDRPASKKGWLMSVVGVFGLIFNNNSTPTLELMVTDMRYLQRGTGWKIPAPVARRLQRQVKGGQMKLETMYDRLLRVMQKTEVEK